MKVLKNNNKTEKWTLNKNHYATEKYIEAKTIAPSKNILKQRKQNVNNRKI